jgi:hypothetical protein
VARALKSLSKASPNVLPVIPYVLGDQAKVSQVDLSLGVTPKVSHLDVPVDIADLMEPL